MRITGALVAVAIVALAGCSGGPGTEATFDPDAPGADASAESGDDTGDGEGSRPVVQGRGETVEEQADLGEYAEQACGRAVTGSGRYSQSGYDRGVREGVEAGLDETELTEAIDEACGDEIREARGE